MSVNAADPKDPYAGDRNPKDIIAADKLPYYCVPETAKAELALALFEGVCKYGSFNWRAKPVVMSVYLDAIDRHLDKFKGGNWHDTKTGIKHLGYVMACAAIIIDADVYGTLIDNRAPRGVRDPNIEAFIDDKQAIVAHIKELFKDYHPHQYTIQDDFDSPPIVPKPQGPLIDT